MDLEAKREQLLQALKMEAEKNEGKAARLECGVGTLKWVLWGALAANGILGIVATLLPHPEIVKPGYFALLSAVAGGFYYLFKITSWRDKSNAFYAYRDKLQELQNRLDFQQLTIAQDVSAASEGIAAVSREWNIARRDLGLRLSAANLSEDQKVAKSPPKEKD